MVDRRADQTVFALLKCFDFCNLDNPLCSNAEGEINFAPFRATFALCALCNSNKDIF